MSRSEWNRSTQRSPGSARIRDLHLSASTTTGTTFDDDGNDSDAQQRAAFLREVTASRAWARFVFWVGFAMVLAGASGCTWLLADGTDAPGASSTAGAAPGDFPAFGPHTVLGPVGTLFFMIGFVGHFVLILGSFLWIIAAAHVRRVDTDPRYPWNTPTSR